MKLAAQLNWERRFLLGFKTTTKNWLWVWRHPDYPHLSKERKIELALIVEQLTKLKQDVNVISKRIDEFKNLPKWERGDPLKLTRTTQDG